MREAFKNVEVVRLDCSHVGTSDCKKIGVKLRVCSIVPRHLLPYYTFILLILFSFFEYSMQPQILLS